MRRFATLVLALILVFSFGFSIDAQEKSFNLEVTPGCGFNMLTWDEVAGATQYFIYRGFGAGEEFETPLLDFPIMETSFKDEINIKDGQEYCYYVTALGADAAEFARSNEACAVPSCYTEPDPDECKLVLRYQQDNVMYFANGEQKGPMDTPPVNVNSRLFLVVRYVTEEIPGTMLEWVGTSKTVVVTTRDGTRIELQIGNKDAKINGEVIQIDPNNPEVVPFIENGRTLLPMRFVAENLGATGPDDIRWYGDTKTVELRFDDPMCDKNGILDPVAEELPDGRFRISATYYSSSGESIPTVDLLLSKKQGSKDISISGKRGGAILGDNFYNIEAGKPVVTVLAPENGTATKFSWVLELDPGIMYFYAFEADKTQERLPEEGLFGPLLTPLEGIKRITELDLSKLKEDDEETIQGFFTHEPYPMLFSDYWQIFERQAPPAGTTVHIKLPKDTFIETGTYISCKVEKEKSTDITPVLKLKDFSIIQKIEIAKMPEMVLAPERSIADIICGGKYGIMFTGGTNAQHAENNGVEYSYERLRADFVADSIRGYDTLLSLGICKLNIHVLFGRGDNEIDLISADDGDGNPFNFDWTDALYRTLMENQAQDKWRVGETWRVKAATKANFENAIDAIVADIEAHPDVDPEIYILVSDHGSRFGAEASEDDNVPGYICSYSGNWLDDTWFTAQVKRINAACGWQQKPTIRVMLGTCHAGEFVDDFNDELKTTGLDAVCLATASNDVGNGWGSWRYAHYDTYGEETGGSFSTPFNISLRDQLTATPGNYSWKTAYDYALANDWAAAGFWKDHDDGSQTYHQSFPQYWRSSDMMAILPGYEVLIPGEDGEEIVDPDLIRLNPVAVGLDASELIYDFCNCQHIDFENDYYRKLKVKNFSIHPTQIRLSCDDESSLDKCGERKHVKFSKFSESGARTYETLTVDLDPFEEVEVYTAVSAFGLRKQPLDANGYMLTEGGLPAFVEVPIQAVATVETDDETYTRSYDANINIRTKGMTFELRYYVENIRKAAEDVFVTINNNHKPILIPELRNVNPDVIATPNSNGQISLEIQTDAYELLPDGTRYNPLDHLDIGFDLRDTVQNACYEPVAEKRIEWGSVSIKLPEDKESLIKSRFSIIEKEVSPITKKTDDKNVYIRFTGSPDNPKSMIGTHEATINYTLNDCHCCEMYGVPEDVREIQLTLRVTITEPTKETASSEYFQAI